MAGEAGGGEARSIKHANPKSYQHRTDSDTCSAQTINKEKFFEFSVTRETFL
jgi:hypothetical protein